MSNNQNQNNGGISDQAFIMFITVVIIALTAKNIDYLEAWAIKHWFILVLMGLAAVKVVLWFMNWRFRMKHPEYYEREVAFRKMQNKRNFDE